METGQAQRDGDRGPVVAQVIARGMKSLALLIRALGEAQVSASVSVEAEELVWVGAGAVEAVALEVEAVASGSGAEMMTSNEASITKRAPESS